MDPATLPWYAYPALTLAGAGAGFVDAIAGGGGLITVPALLAAGLPPHIALGTNKLQSTLGMSVTVGTFARAKLVAWSDVKTAAPTAFVAGAAGALSVSRLSPEHLRRVVPFLLVALVIYTALRPRLGDEKRHALVPPVIFGLIAGAVLGFYDGFFGPGTGAFWAAASVMLLGLDLKHATGYTKVVNFASNAGALLVFLSLGNFHPFVALSMVSGQMVGARCGSRLVLAHGARLIRPVFLTVVTVLAARLLWQAFS